MYYLIETGEKRRSIVFMTSYICVNCGIEFDFDLKKLKKILSENINYRIDLVERTIEEIHYENFFSTYNKVTVSNKVSKISLDDFLAMIALRMQE